VLELRSGVGDNVFVAVVVSVNDCVEGAESDFVLDIVPDRGVVNVRRVMDILPLVEDEFIPPPRRNVMVIDTVGEVLLLT